MKLKKNCIEESMAELKNCSVKDEKNEVEKSRRKSVQIKFAGHDAKRWYLIVVYTKGIWIKFTVHCGQIFSLVSHCA